MKTITVILGLATISFAQAQIVNGNFDGGNLSGWTVTNTSNGTTAVADVVMLDIDEGGPLGMSNAARFAVGNAAAPNQGQQGIMFSQMVSLVGGITYTFDMDWKAFRVNTTTSNTEGGQFTLMAGGNSIAFGAAGTTSQAAPKFGHLTGMFTPVTSGDYEVGVKITRQFTVPLLSGVPTLYQAVDNFTMTGVPEPATMAALGLGVIAVIRKRRK